MLETFVDIRATDGTDSVAMITGKALAVARPDGVDATGHLVTSTAVDRAFVHVGAS